MYLVLLIILFTRYADLFSLLFILMQREIPNVSILRYQLKLHSMQLYMFYKLGYLQEGITHQMNCLFKSTGNFQINRKWDSLRKFRKHRIPALCLQRSQIKTLSGDNPNHWINFHTYFILIYKYTRHILRPMMCLPSIH